MALINPPIPVAQMTVDQQKAHYAHQIGIRLNAQFQALKMNYQFIHDLIWENDYLTPQQMFDALGVNAGPLYTLAQTMKTLVNNLVPNTITVTDPKTVTVNDDGTVTVGA